jgi:hypothetical protein
VPTNHEILNRIFSEADLKFGLKLFTEAEIKRLTFTLDGDKTYISCPVSGRKKLAKPEEVVRQLMIDRLHYELGYVYNQMAVEVPIKMGSSYASKKADIVVYRDASKQQHHIVTECKKPARTDGIEQLESYMNATGVWWGAWTNGNEDEYPPPPNCGATHSNAAPICGCGTCFRTERTVSMSSRWPPTMKWNECCDPSSSLQFLRGNEDQRDEKTDDRAGGVGGETDLRRQQIKGSLHEDD